MDVATYGKVVSITPIPGADRIEQATVVCGKNGIWRGVVTKREFLPGSVVEVYLQDAIIPEAKRILMPFMEKYDWRVRMARMRGALSECVIFPANSYIEPGTAIQCEKYEKQLPASMAGKIYGNFPSFIPKTDEPNFQAAPELVSALVGNPYYVSVKCDGTSVTVYKNEGHFGVCSRNLELVEDYQNALWKMVDKYNLHRMSDGYAMQFELVGPGIQKNPMGLDELEARLFNVFNIEKQEYVAYMNLPIISSVFGIPLVDVLSIGNSFPQMPDDELRSLAQGNYGNGHPREGIVIRQQANSSPQSRISFKVINLDYKE